MFVGLAPRGGPAVARDLGSAADMFVGLTAWRWRATSAARRTCSSASLPTGTPRWRATSAARRTWFVGLAPRGHVRRPHDPAADMLVGLAPRGVGLAPRGGPAATLDLGSAADMFVGLVPRGGTAAKNGPS